MAGKVIVTQAEQEVVDTAAIKAKLSELSMNTREIRNANKSGLRKSLTIIRQSVRRGAAAVTSNREKQTKGVDLKIYRNGSGGQVNIYKAFYLSDGSVFILRWLEEGTKAGEGKNHRYHGATPAKPFFAQAVRAVLDKAQRVLSDNILAAIDKVAARRK